MDLFKVVIKLLKQYRTIEQMCSDAHSITLREWSLNGFPLILIKQLFFHVL